MLLVAGRHGDLIRDVLNQLVRIDHAVLVLIRRAFQALHDEIAEDPVAPAELRAFDGNFLGPARQQPEEIALHVAQMLHVRVDRRVLNGADGAGLAHIHKQEHSADFLELIFEQRPQLRHRQRRAGQILRVGIIGQDECVLTARNFDRAMSGDHDHHRVVLAGPAFEEILKSVADRRGGGFFVRQKHHIPRGDRAAERALQQFREHVGIGVGELQRQLGLRIFRNPDQQRIGLPAL
jgi:hypothetical protein